MPTIQSDTVEYKFNLDEIKKMFANELKVPVDAISVKFNQTDTSNERYDRYPSYEVTSISVTVDNKKIKK